MFQTKAAEKSEIYILCSLIFFPQIMLFMTLCGKYGKAGQATDGNKILRMRLAC
jgi:hypothetical protein